MITYEQGREISLWTWRKIVREHLRKKPFKAIDKHFKMGVPAGCGFCMWAKPKKAACSACPLSVNGMGCHPDYEQWEEWQYRYFNCFGTPYSEKTCERWMEYWAKKFLAFLESTPEHLKEEEKT